MLTVPATARVCLSVPLFTFLQHTSKNKPSDHYKPVGLGPARFLSHQMLSNPHALAWSRSDCLAHLLHAPRSPCLATCDVPNSFSKQLQAPASIRDKWSSIRRRAFLRHVAEHPASATAPSAKRGRKRHVMVHLQRLLSLAQLQANTCGRMVPGCKQVLGADQVCQDRE